ncbi:hypothetical protein D3C85_1814180 [compost metagenome]
MVDVAGVAQQGHTALPIQWNHRGLQGVITVADAVFIDHIAVCTQIQVLGKLAQKLVVDRQADRAVGMKHRCRADQGADIQEG